MPIVIQAWVRNIADYFHLEVIRPLINKIHKINMDFNDLSEILNEDNKA